MTEYIIGTGPPEAHAHIDLYQRMSQLGTNADLYLAVIATACQAGHWSVVAEVRAHGTGEST